MDTECRKYRLLRSTLRDDSRLRVLHLWKPRTRCGSISYLTMGILGYLGNNSFLFQRLFSFKAPCAREELDLTSPKSIQPPYGAAIAAGSVLFLACAWIWAPR